MTTIPSVGLGAPDPYGPETAAPADTPPHNSTPPTRPGPWPAPGGRRTFATYLTGESASLIGTSVHGVAMPVLAVLHLHATPEQVAVLYILGQIPAFLLALPAGAFVDRHPKQPVMIATDLVAACLAVVIPIVAAIGTLSMPVLYTVAFLLGSVTVLHQAAASAIVPQLVAPALLHQATSRLEAALGAAGTTGTYLGTVVVAVTGAAKAFAVDAVSYLASAWCASRIAVAAAPPSRNVRTSLIKDVSQGLRYVASDPLLRPLALCLGGTGAGAGMVTAFSAWYLLTAVQTGPTGLGVILGISAAGYPVGALAAPRIVGRFGPGTVLIVGVALYALMDVPLLVASPGPLWLAVLAAAGALQLGAAGCASATVRAVRQQICPPPLRARAQQTATWLVAGSRPLAALAAGALASAAGVWAALLAGTLVLTVTALALWASPVRKLSVMPTPMPPSPDVHTDVRLPGRQDRPDSAGGER
ncbi:MFS transporter [Streptomyces virginiae]|uniref:MFS transporter n=1 Tax=Streptomyces virginiae TaxID=1961 RepID=UPI00367887DC